MSQFYKLGNGSGPIPPGFFHITPVTGPTTYVVLPTDQYLSVDDTFGATTIQLPNTTTTGRVIVIKDRTGTANTFPITVTTVGGVVNIDGMPIQLVDTNYGSMTVVFDGTAWEIW